jgi:mannose-6-phosphate isomerase-like protein (cupin superfamily)
MPLITIETSPIFDMHGAVFQGMSSPSRGAKENSVWIVTIAGGTPGTTHQVTREETLIGLEGTATALLGGETYELSSKTALVIPANTDFQLSNLSGAPFCAVVVLPVGGQARMANQDPFTPPWAR